MPELPEVETVVRSIARLKGRRIVSAEFRACRVVRGGDPDAMARAVSGKRIAGISRRGKFILISLEGGGYLVIHLGMTGRLLLGGERSKHTHAVLNLDRGALLYEDPRQFGCVQFCERIPDNVERLGPEPLEIGIEEFGVALRRRKGRIKAVLLDQTLVRGLGNIYADETLHRAGIHPMTSAARIRGERLKRLHEAMTAVLTEAIAAGGSSVSDYVSAEGRKGFFQFSHRVYRRTGEPCKTCGSPIRRLVISQRSSHFCPKCQKR
jgi:formamidopyrimidine-DNA glycosylase